MESTLADMTVWLDPLGIDVLAEFTGPAVDCPGCRAPVTGATLDLGAHGIEPASCQACGVVLVG